MFTLAAITLSPVGIITWLVVGLIAGWSAARIMKGGGYGLVGDMIVGLIGAAGGGLILGLMVTTEVGFWGSVIVAILGACIFIAISRFLGFGPYGGQPLANRDTPR